MIASKPRIKAIIGFETHKKADKKIIITVDVIIDSAKITLFPEFFVLLFTVCAPKLVTLLSSL